MEPRRCTWAFTRDGRHYQDCSQILAWVCPDQVIAFVSLHYLDPIHWPTHRTISHDANVHLGSAWKFIRNEPSDFWLTNDRCSCCGWLTANLAEDSPQCYECENIGVCAQCTYWVPGYGKRCVQCDFVYPLLVEARVVKMKEMIHHVLDAWDAWMLQGDSSPNKLRKRKSFAEWKRVTCRQKHKHRSALHHFIDSMTFSRRMVGVTEELIGLSANRGIINAKTTGAQPRGYAPLHFACDGSLPDFRKAEIVEDLLRARADLEATDSKGNTPLSKGNTPLDEDHMRVVVIDAVKTGSSFRSPFLHVSTSFDGARKFLMKAEFKREQNIDESLQMVVIDLDKLHQELGGLVDKIIALHTEDAQKRFFSKGSLNYGPSQREGSQPTRKRQM